MWEAALGAAAAHMPLLWNTASIDGLACEVLDCICVSSEKGSMVCGGPGDVCQMAFLSLLECFFWYKLAMKTFAVEKNNTV